MTFDMIAWIEETAEAICELALTPPISWIVGLIICVFIVDIVLKLCRIGR